MLYNKVLTTWFSALLSVTLYCADILLTHSPLRPDQGHWEARAVGWQGSPPRDFHIILLSSPPPPPILNKSPCISINQMLRQLFLESLGNYHYPRDQRNQRMKKLYKVWKGSCFFINDTQKGYFCEGEPWCQDKVTAVTAVNIRVLNMYQVLW